MFRSKKKSLFCVDKDKPVDFLEENIYLRKRVLCTLIHRRKHNFQHNIVGLMVTSEENYTERTQVVLNGQWNKAEYNTENEKLSLRYDIGKIP